MAFWDNPLLRKTILFMLAGVISLAAITAMSLWLTFKVQANADEAARAQDKQPGSRRLLPGQRRRGGATRFSFG
jgi:hypothetical protein